MAVAFCHRCNRETQWNETRGGIERCAGCADRFPCRNDSCGHLDCADARPHQHLTTEEILNMATTKKSTKAKTSKKTAAKKPAAKKTATKAKAKAKPAAKTPAPKAAKKSRTFDPTAKTDANPTGKTIKLANGSIVPAFKYCAKCDADHPADEFYANAGRPSGLSDWCKMQFKAWNKAARAKKAKAS